jgi:hypothetical protein
MGFGAISSRRKPHRTWSPSAVDIAPTILAHLGLAQGSMDGDALQRSDI